MATEKAENVHIIKISPINVPQQTVGGVTMATIVYGLGDDNVLYCWDGKTHKWVLA